MNGQAPVKYGRGPSFHLGENPKVGHLPAKGPIPSVCRAPAFGDAAKASEMSPGSRTKPVLRNGRLCCPICGCDYIHRLPRITFAQRTYLAFFGLYPWECGQCKEPFLLHRRYSRHHSRENHYAD